jgi:hypothetical protein
MKAASVLFAIEAALLGSPAIALIVYAAHEMSRLLPFISRTYRAGDATISLYMLFFDSAVVLISVLALVVLARFVIKTILNRPFRFGPDFWILLLSGLVIAFLVFCLCIVMFFVIVIY